MKTYIKTVTGDILIKFKDSDSGSLLAYPLSCGDSMSQAIKNLVDINYSDVSKESESLAMVMI